jgi:hypothetical protein
MLTQDLGEPWSCASLIEVLWRTSEKCVLGSKRIIPLERLYETVER